MSLSLPASGATSAGSKPWTALLVLNLATVIFGTTALFGKLDVSPVWIVAGRASFAAATLLGISLLRRIGLRARRSDLLRIFATGALLAAHWVTFFISVQEAGVAVATLTFATFPLVTGLVDAALQRRSPTIVEVGSGLVIVLAVLLLVGRDLPGADVGRAGGAFIGLMSAACFAVFSVASQRLGRSIHPVALSLYQNIAVVVVLAGFLPFAPRVPHGLDWLAIAALGVVATALMHQLYFFALRRLPAAVCGSFVALEPVYAILFAAILFAEPVSLTVVLSGALIIGASIMLLTHPPAVAAPQQ